MKKLIILVPLLAVLAIQAATLNVRRIKNAATPPTPTNFTVTVIGDNPTNVFLTWGNPVSTYSNIVVQRSTNTVVWGTLTNLFGTNDAFTDLYTWGSTPAYYRIKATGSNGLSSDYNNQL